MKSKQLLNNLPFAPRKNHALLFFVVLMICTVLAMSSDFGREIFRYQSDLTRSNEYWRIFTGHLVHLGWSHFFLNMLGFSILWLLYAGMYSVKQWVSIFLISSVGISFGFLLFDKNLSWYVGLSGVLHAIFAVTICRIFLLYISKRQKKIQWEDLLLMIFLVAKLIYEQVIGPVPLTESGSGGPVVVNAHLYGAIMGCICSVFLFKFTHLNFSK